MKFQKLHEISSFKLKDVIKIHRIMNTRHQQDNVTLDLSCDDVADANSSGVTMDMITVRFPECRTVYPLVSIRPIDKTSVNFLEELDKVLSDFKVNDVKIRNIICDNPMRALMRNCKNHASYFSCEYCRSSASYYIDVERRNKAETDHKLKVSKIKSEIAKLSRRKGNEQQITELQEHIKEADIYLKSCLKSNKVCCF